MKVQVLSARIRDQLLDELDQVHGQLMWHKRHPFIVRPEVIDQLYKRKLVAEQALNGGLN